MTCIELVLIFNLKCVIEVVLLVHSLGFVWVSSGFALDLRDLTPEHTQTRSREYPGEVQVCMRVCLDLSSFLTLECSEEFHNFY